MLLFFELLLNDLGGDGDDDATDSGGVGGDDVDEGGEPFNLLT